MGHIRLGRLPKTLRWRGVVALLDESPVDVSAVARATALAAEERLRELAHDPALTRCFWVLTRLTWASRSANFTAELANIGLPPPRSDSALAFIAQVTQQVRDDTARGTQSGLFAELAILAMRRALTDTIGQEGRSLFGSSLEDLHRAVRHYSIPARFGILAKYFFGDFFARTLRMFVERELSNNVGAGHALAGIDASREFAGALDTYARQSARIMEPFAEGWYGKHNWESRGAISPDEAQGFVAVALRKLRQEITRSELTP
jgi:hypothetical protein